VLKCHTIKEINMTYKEYTGKRVSNKHGRINGVGVKIPVYERDVLLAKIATKQGTTYFDMVASRADEQYQEMTCAELKAVIG
jgi:hypothetical protein